MRRSKSVSVFLIVGLLIVGIAIFSGELGLSAEASKVRIAMLILGLLIGLFPWISWKRSEAEQKAFQSDLFAFPALLIVIAVYLSCLGASRNATSNYYDLLGTSFREGELSLSLRPDPALLALPNPYDPAARQGIKAPLDLSLYKGKFYLYWGPAPALLVAIVKPFIPGQVSDGYLLFVFICGIFLSQFLLIRHLWGHFFPDIPRWIVILSILVAGLIHPTLWLLGQPKIYETAIAGGQFFFIAGLFLALTAIDHPPASPWRLALAGILWSLAVGTRSVLVFPVLFMTLLIVIWAYQLSRPSLRAFVARLIPLGIPLAIGAMAFAWYNWARFGSIAETGFSYALAGPDLQKHLHELFSPVYIFQNLYNYLLNPFTIQESFPFLQAVRGRIEEIVPGQVLPEIYSAQAVTGVLWAAPFTLFAILPARPLFKKNQTTEDVQQASLRWMMSGLMGSSLLAFACLMAFFWAAMRYAEDFMPTLILLSILGFWQGYRAGSQNSHPSKAYTTLGSILAGLSILTSALLALSIYISI